MATVDDLKIDMPAPARPARTAPSSFRRLRLGVLAIPAALVLWTFRSGGDSRPLRVAVHTVPAARSGGAGFTAGGYLEVIPPGPTVVSTLVEGPVASLDVVEGQRVQAGQILGRLDDSLHRQELRLLETKVTLSRSRLARQEAGFRQEEVVQALAEQRRAEARLHLARKRMVREGELLRIGVIPRAAYEASTAEVQFSEADLTGRRTEVELRQNGYRKEDIEIARAELAATEAERDRAAWRVEACVIRAPISGIVLERYVQPGDWISPRMSPSNQRERPGSLVSLIDPARIQAWVDVNQRDIEHVSVGQRALLSTDARPDRSVRGRVSRVLPKANLQKNTVRVNVEIPEVPEDFRPEMSVKVDFLVEDRPGPGEGAIVIPTSAVSRDAKGAFVFVVVDGRARRRDVTVTGQSADRPMIGKGVSAGDQIVIQPDGLAEGQPVELER